MVHTQIRLIIFFVAEDGKALYSQQKQDLELTWAPKLLWMVTVDMKLKDFSFFEGKKEKKGKLLSCNQLFAIPRTVAHHTPPSMEFSKQEYWNVLPLPSPGDLPHPGIKPRSPTLQTDALCLSHKGIPLGGNIMAHLDSVLKSRDITLKCPHNKSYAFSSSHIWM